MVDLIKIHLKAGNGGDGRISFLSNRYQLKGGPDGGNGGNGGSILIIADENLHSLRDFSGKTEIEAKSGEMGGKLKMFGAGSPDLTLKLPVGTTIWRSIEDYEPRRQKRMYTIDREEGRREWVLGAERRARQEALIPKVLPVGAAPAKLTKTFQMGGRAIEAEWFGEVTTNGQELKVCKGGRGGRGNFEFRSSTHTTPREAETGQGGEAGTFFFELQVLADVGFVGFPNAGKSTLLSVLTAARPEIAAYPFTTIQPNLGILEFASRKEGKVSFVVADIPGIIEGASEGKGLGTSFLRHIERCRVLLFVLSLEDYDVLTYADDVPVLVEKLTEQYNQLLDELAQHQAKQELTGEEKVLPFTKKKKLVVINKADLYTQELQTEIAAEAGKALDYPLFISAKANIGIDQLKRALHSVLK